MLKTLDQITSAEEANKEEGSGRTPGHAFIHYRREP
jgi:hypothetical protein